MINPASRRAKRLAGQRRTPDPKGKLRFPCHICDAGIGRHCVVWKVDKGVRVSIMRTMIKPHPERGTDVRNG